MLYKQYKDIPEKNMTTVSNKTWCLNKHILEAETTVSQQNFLRKIYTLFVWEEQKTKAFDQVKELIAYIACLQMSRQVIYNSDGHI